VEKAETLGNPTSTSFSRVAFVSPFGTPLVILQMKHNNRLNDLMATNLNFIISNCESVKVDYPIFVVVLRNPLHRLHLDSFFLFGVLYPKVYNTIWLRFEHLFNPNFRIHGKGWSRWERFPPTLPRQPPLLRTER
jgi:hypothetical protein